VFLPLAFDSICLIGLQSHERTLLQFALMDNVVGTYAEISVQELLR
jgi:hypothetical protein